MGMILNLASIEAINYDIRIITDLFNTQNEFLNNHIINKRAFCIVDLNVSKLYKEKWENYFLHYNIQAYCYTVESSEKIKNISTVTDFINFCFGLNISRKDSIICIGGGIVCDIGGFSASLIRRGTPCIKIPTTLIGIIDASIGVKNGVNFSNIKNSIGGYSAPSVVFCDLFFLKTLSINQIKFGLVEMIKIIALKDVDTWELLKKNVHSFYEVKINDVVIELIRRSILFMIEELRDNLYEQKLERIVDYGHEFGHQIEVITEYQLSHGESVGIGMIISNIIARNNKLITGTAFDDFYTFYSQLNLPLWHKKLNADLLYESKDSIRRHKNGKVSLVSIRKIGQPIFIEDFNYADIQKAVMFLQESPSLTHPQSLNTLI